MTNDPLLFGVTVIRPVNRFRQFEGIALLQQTTEGQIGHLSLETVTLRILPFVVPES